MKKFRVILNVSLFVAISMLSFNNFAAYAQVDQFQKELAKKQSKMAKDLVKRYEKEGWKLANNNTTVEVAVLKHLIATADESKTATKIGEVSKCKSMNVGRFSAQTNAQNALSQQLSAQVKGVVTSIVGADAENVDNEIDKMIAGFESKVKANLAGVLKESYSIYKENADGTYWFRTFFVVDLDKCKNAANSALEKSLQETKQAIDISTQIREFVNSGLVVGD